MSLCVYVCEYLCVCVRDYGSDLSNGKNSDVVDASFYVMLLTYVAALISQIVNLVTCHRFNSLTHNGRQHHKPHTHQT